MKKKVIHIILIFLLIISINNVCAATFVDVLNNLNEYDPRGDIAYDSERAPEVISKIVSMISLVGIAVSVVMLATLGLKYMMGSVEEKAEYKQSLLPYLIGAIMLFGITTITQILVKMGEGIANL